MVAGSATPSRATAAAESAEASGRAAIAKQNHNASRICLVKETSKILQRETRRSGMASSWRIASDNKAASRPAAQDETGHHHDGAKIKE